MNDMSKPTAIIPFDETPLDVSAFFAAPATVDAVLDRITAIVDQHEPDLTTAKGRAAIKSLAANVARSKTALDEAGKELNAGHRAAMESVDRERRRIREQLDALRDRARDPLTKWEEAEAARKAAMEARIASISVGALTTLSPSATLAQKIGEIEAIVVDETWAEFQDEAAFARDTTLATLRSILEGAQKRESDEAELAKLRAEAAERERQDAIRAAQEKAERDAAEAKARAERAEAEAEARRIEAEAERAREIERAKEAALAQAEAQAAKERADLERRAAEAERKAEEAVAAERERAERERKAAEVAAASRERNKRLREAMAGQIATSLAGIEPFEPRAVAEAIMAGRIASVFVKY